MNSFISYKIYPEPHFMSHNISRAYCGCCSWLQISTLHRGSLLTDLIFKLAPTQYLLTSQSDIPAIMTQSIPWSATRSRDKIFINQLAASLGPALHCALELEMKIIPRFAKISESTYWPFYIEETIQTRCMHYF